MSAAQNLEILSHHFHVTDCRAVKALLQWQTTNDLILLLEEKSKILEILLFLYTTILSQQNEAQSWKLYKTVAVEYISALTIISQLNPCKMQNFFPISFLFHLSVAFSCDNWKCAVKKQVNTAVFTCEWVIMLIGLSNAIPKLLWRKTQPRSLITTLILYVKER